MAEDVSRMDDEASAEEEGVKDVKTSNMDKIVNSPAGTEQAVNPSDILAPNFALEDQERVATELQPTVVMAPPGYSSPDPRTNAVPLLAVEDHPLSGDLAEDYGDNVNLPVESEEQSVSPLVGEEMAAAGGGAGEVPDDVDEWTKEQWQEAAAARGLPTSGTKAEIADRIDEYDANQPEPEAEEAPAE